MDKNRLKQICSKILNKYNLIITDFQTHPTNQLCDDGTWKKHSYCVFIGVVRKEGDFYDKVDVSKILEDYLGFEFIVDFSY